MYCGNADLIQSKIRINNEDTYVCNKNKIEISCRVLSIFRNVKNEFYKGCVNEVMQCDLKNGIIENIYCSEGTLFSRSNMYCGESRNDIYAGSILDCHDGKLPKNQTSFIPTTTSTTEYPIFTTTPKPLSLSANVHIFLLKMMGKSEVLETTTQESFPYPDSNAWHPEALTFPIETTRKTSTTERTTTKAPYEWMEKVYKYYEDGTFETTFRPVPKNLLPFPFETDPIIPPNWYKIYTTSTESYKEETSTEATTTTSTEPPYVWMIKVPSSDSNEEDRFEPIPEEYVATVEQFGIYIPDNWMKVPVNKVFELVNRKS
jgi:hypothetical protein